MSFTCGFYNSQDGDRVYSTSQISDFLNGLVTDGVYQHINDGDHYGLQVVEQTPQAMGVNVSIGKAWFNSTWSKVTSPEPVTIPGSSALLNRIDAVCLTVNTNRSVRDNYFEVISGTETSGVPEKPTVSDEPNIYRHVLAWVTVNAAASVITNANIERNIGTDDVPFVKGIIDAGVTVDQLNAQWKAEFTEWFDYMKDQLTEDAAGNLQTEIDDVRSDLAEEITNRETAVEGERDARISAIDQLRQDFTDGCNAIANALIAQGVTPTKAGTNYTPDELIDAVDDLLYSRIRQVNVSKTRTTVKTGEVQRVERGITYTYEQYRATCTVAIGSYTKQFVHDYEVRVGQLGGGYGFNETWTQNV